MVRRGGGTGTGWTVLALAGAGGAMAIDGAGRIVTGRRGWSLDWEVRAGPHRCVPGAAASLRQRATGSEEAAPVALETLVRAADGDVSQLVYAARGAGAGPGAFGVLEVRNGTSAPVAVTLTLHPGDFWRPEGLWSVEIDGAGAFANGTRALWWQRAPAGARLLADAAAAVGEPEASTPVLSRPGVTQRVRSRRGRAGAVLTWPVTHGGALEVLLPLESGEASPPATETLPNLAQVGRGWDSHTAEGLRVTGLADGRIETLLAAAIRRLLALDVAPESGDGPDGRLSPGTRVLVAAALAVAGYARRAAEVVSIRAARNPAGAARLARQEAARLTAPFGDVASAVAGAMAEAAGPGGGWSGEGGGDDPALRAAFLLAVRDTLVTEQGGCLDLLRVAGAAGDLAGSRQPVEVHRLGTGGGLLSFGLRWHNGTPALLWELASPATRLESWACALAAGGAPNDAAAPPRLRASALSESWSTDRAAGEALLRP